MSKARRRVLIESNMWIVAAVAGAICNGSTPVMIKEDAISEGYVALVEAAGKFRGPTAKFTGYAYTRVRGAIVDELRRAYSGAFILGVDLEGVADPGSEVESELDFSRLSKAEFWVIERFGMGYSLAEIDRELNKPRGWAWRKKEKAILKISGG